MAFTFTSTLNLSNVDLALKARRKNWKMRILLARARALHKVRLVAATMLAFFAVPFWGRCGRTNEQNAFYERVSKWPLFIAAAFPRFQDVYA